MKNINGKIVALITAQSSCEKIIKFAEEYAERLACELVILTAQPLKTTANNRSKDMICLTELSKKTGHDIKIIYSKYPLEAAIKETAKISPKHIFIGQGGKKSEFLTHLRIYIPNCPISVVEKDEIIYSIPGISGKLIMTNQN